MTKPRKEQVCLDTTPYYHCVSRCVRRGYLCGYDQLTQQNYAHRREWILARIQQVAEVYCVNVCAFAIMSNHYHLVVHINRDLALQLTDIEVVNRWNRLHKLPKIVQNYISTKRNSKAKIIAAKKRIHKWRNRLFDLSWFMKEINLDIAQRANQEDECTGHFWEGRFKSQALLDEKGLLSAMAYTDLNPVRAGICTTPQNSEFTSIKQRLNAELFQQSSFLATFNSDIVPFSFNDYLESLDWTARNIKPTQKPNVENKATPSILIKTNIPPSNWLSACKDLERPRTLQIGGEQSLVNARLKAGKLRNSGLSFPD